MKKLGTLVCLLAIGCDAPPTSSAVISPEPSPAVRFQRLLDASIRELQAKNEANRDWGLGSFDRWDLDQDAGTLTFSQADGTSVVTSAQIIGSFSTRDNSWLWAWDNPSIDDKLKVDAFQVRAYGEQHGISRLTSRKWTGSEEDAWAMAALATKLCNAEGAYRGPSGHAYIFMTFRDVQVRSAATLP